MVVLALCGASALLRSDQPDPPPSFDAEFGRVAAQERELLNRFKAASARFQAGELPDAEFANMTERELLPADLDVRRAVHELKDHPQADQQAVLGAEVLTVLRIESWQVLLEGLREQKVEKLQEFARKRDEANAFARGVMKRTRRP